MGMRMAVPVAMIMRVAVMSMLVIIVPMRMGMIRWRGLRGAASMKLL